MNSTNCTSSHIVHQNVYNGSVTSNRTSTNHAGSLGYGVGRLAREAFDQLYGAWHSYWNKPSPEEILQNRQSLIYLNGLKAFADQLDSACVGLAKNPKDPHTLKKVEKLIAEHPQYIKPQVREDFSRHQQSVLKEIADRISKLKPPIREKLKPLLPVVFQNIKAQKEGSENGSKLNNHKMAVRDTTKQQHDRTEGKPVQEKHQYQKRQKTEICQTINLNNANQVAAIQAPNDAILTLTISRANDLTGDNISDFMIGAPNASPSSITQSAGMVWLINGGQDFTKLNLSNFTTANGILINGVNPYDSTGSSLSALGDFNNDGKNDILIGAPAYNSFSQNGTAYVLFGPIQNSINLASLNGNNGFRINSLIPGDGLGSSVSGGDINGDKIPDLVVGAPNASPNGISAAGEVIVIFGGGGPWPSQFDLNRLNGRNGFIIYGPSVDAFFGGALNVNDFNGDGIADIAATASGASAPGLSNTGILYVIYGQNSTSWTSPFTLTNLNGINGFAAYGAPNDQLGVSVNIGGDFNAAGYQDVSIGATGKIYILFRPPAIATVNLATITTNQGMEIEEGTGGEGLGSYIATIDINNDGHTDLVAGMPDSNEEVGSLAVFLGQANGLPNPINLAELNGTEGFIINGVVQDGLFGSGVANLGDISGDGLDDLGASAPAAENGNGAVYIIYAQRTLTTICSSPTTHPPTTQPPTSTATIQPTTGVTTTTSSTTGISATTTNSPTTASASATPTTSSATPSSATTSLSTTQSTSSGQSVRVLPIAIALGVGIPFLVGLVVIAVLFLRHKKRACFAEKQEEPGRRKDSDYMLMQL